MSNAKDFLKVYWPLVALALLGLLIGFMFMKPAPPSSIRMAAGSPGGAYYAYAQRYQRLLGEQGVDVELIETAGSIENLQLLNVGDAEFALIQGGLAVPADAENLRSLGGLFYEPFWVFSTIEDPAATFETMRGKRLAVGPDGSGTRALAIQLQTEYGGIWPDASRLSLSGKAAADALLADKIDAAAFSASVDAPYIQTLLRSPNVQLLAFRKAPALARRRPALASVPLLRGVVDVGDSLPDEDVPLIASIAQLGVRADVHPAIQTLLLESAVAIHSDGSLLNSAGTFPDGDATDLPISKQASRYYRNGPSALRRYFSFGMANFLERAWVLAIPLLTLMFPLLRAAPPLYRWRVRRKIYVWYEDIRALEARGRHAKSDAERAQVCRELEDLQVEIGELEVPLSYTDDLYRLRGHVAFVKDLVSGRAPDGALTA